MSTKQDQDEGRFVLVMMFAVACLMLCTFNCLERSRPRGGPPPGPFSSPWGSPREGDLFYNPEKREQIETFRSTLGGKRHASPQTAGRP